MKNYWKMIGIFILLVAIHQGLAFIYVLPFAMFYALMGIQGAEYTELVLAQSVNATIFSGIGATIIFYLLFIGKKDNLFKRSQFNKITLKQIGWSTLIGFSFVFFSHLIVQMLANLFPIQYIKFAESMDFMNNAPVIAVFIAVVIVAPLFEEIMFRGIVYDQLQKRMNVFKAAVIAGLLFGIYHLNIFQGTYATLIGVAMGFSLIWTKSIWAPIIIHFVNNLISIILSYTVIGVWLNLENTLPLILSITIALTLLPFGMYKLYQARVIEIPNDIEIDEVNLEQELDPTI